MVNPWFCNMEPKSKPKPKVSEKEKLKCKFCVVIKP